MLDGWPHFRGWSSNTLAVIWDIVLNTKVFSFQGIGIERFCYIQRCSYFRRLIPLCTEVFLFQEVGMEGFHCIQRCSHSMV